MNKYASLKDLKVRIVDHIKAGGLTIGHEDIRLWHYNDANVTDREESLQNRCKQVKESLSQIQKGEKPAEATDPGDPDAELEMNSGVDFPGQSLEPLLRSALRVTQLK